MGTSGFPYTIIRRSIAFGRPAPQVGHGQTFPGRGRIIHDTIGLCIRKNRRMAAKWLRAPAPAGTIDRGRSAADRVLTQIVSERFPSGRLTGPAPDAHPTDRSRCQGACRGSRRWPRSMFTCRFASGSARTATSTPSRGSRRPRRTSPPCGKRSGAALPRRTAQDFRPCIWAAERRRSSHPNGSEPSSTRCAARSR